MGHREERARGIRSVQQRGKSRRLHQRLRARMRASIYAGASRARERTRTQLHARMHARTNARANAGLISRNQSHMDANARAERLQSPRCQICRIARSRERRASTAHRRCHQTARDHQVSSGLVKMHRTISVPTHSTRASSSTSASADAPLDWTWADVLWLPPRSKVTSNTPQ